MVEDFLYFPLTEEGKFKVMPCKNTECFKYCLENFGTSTYINLKMNEEDFLLLTLKFNGRKI